MKLILFIDLENIIQFNLDNIDMTTTKVYIFVGKNQKKIPIELVTQTQRFGDSLEWIKIEGQGKNALDFHIVYFLGELNQKSQQDIQFIILSRDTGFDSLITYINKSGRKCIRIKSLIELNEKDDFD